MQKKSLFVVWLFSLLVIPALFAQPSPPLGAFKDGESFEFRVHYGIFNASYISLTLEEKVLDGRPVFHAQGYGKTTGLARWFFKVEDYYESYFDAQTGVPYYFIRNIYEGGYTKNIEMRFDHQTGFVAYNDKKKGQEKTLSFIPRSQDLISAFYYLRNFFPKTAIPVGDSFDIDMFFDQENYRFRLRYMGKEVLETPFGKIRCLKMSPSVQSGRVFDNDESVIVWVSDDLNRIPIKVQANIAVGSIEIDLERFRNIKHPFEIHLD
ncbi:MAG: DUF3108 domain-containing protein [Flavobacteriaceae bacterium]